MSALPVGVIGLGHIGLPVAGNLIDSGESVLGYQRGDPARLLALGGRAADSPAELAAGCEVVFTNLPSGALAENVDALSSAPRSRLSVVVDLGISTHEDKQAARDRLASVDVMMLDAPISGTPQMTRAHEAHIFASGERDVFRRVERLLGAIGTAHYVGDFGAGIDLKYVANLLVAVHAAAAAEALAFAETLGLDPSRAVEILADSAAGSAALQSRGPTMVSGDFSSKDTTIGAMRSVLSEIRAAGEHVAARMPMMDRASELYDTAAERGHADEDIAVLVAVLAAGGG